MSAHRLDAHLIPCLMDRLMDRLLHRTKRCPEACLKQQLGLRLHLQAVCVPAFRPGSTKHSLTSTRSAEASLARVFERPWT